MRYHELKNKLQSLRIFSLNDIYLVDPDFRQPTLYDWEKKGKVEKICNKWYIFGDFKPQGNDYYLISNKIYTPSYISLELALNHYGIIPEAVQQITAVTTRKTKTFETGLGVFSYKSIKSELFFGYTIIKSREVGINIASPEKALLDYFYLHPSIQTMTDIESLRYNREILREGLNRNKLKKYLEVFDNQSLNKRIKVLLNYISA